MMAPFFHTMQTEALGHKPYFLKTKSSTTGTPFLSRTDTDLKSTRTKWFGDCFKRLKMIFADSAYGKTGLPDWVKSRFGIGSAQVGCCLIERTHVRAESA